MPSYTGGMDSLQDILGSKKFTPPDEMDAIKNYVKDKYKAVAQVKLSRGALIVSVPNSALAATLHLEREKMIDACKIKGKKLVFRTH